MQNKYSQLSNDLNSIINNFLSIEFLVNPFFRISKTTPEQTKIYESLIRNHSFMFYILESIVFLMVNIVKSFIYFLMSFALLYQYFLVSKSHKKFNYIFITHAIGANIDMEQGDQYFGFMPEFLASQKQQIAMFYINHNKFGFRKNYHKLKTKNLPRYVYLSPKFMLPHENLFFIYQATVYSFECLRIGLRFRRKNPDQSKIIIAAIPHFFGRGAYANYLLKLRCLQILKENNPEFFIFTLEGHSYEQYIFDSINKTRQNCNSIFYQHSPIVPGHLGLLNFLQNLKTQTNILVTGPIYKKYLETFSANAIIHIVGSQKSKKSKLLSLADTGGCLLFVPEGTKQATLEFIYLIRDLVKHRVSKKLILRLHPNLKKNWKIRLNIAIMNHYENICVSSGSLYSDLENSDFVFFRSSAVGVEALLSDAILVFYANINESDLNPLFLTDNIALQASNTFEVLDLINSKYNTQNPQERLNKFNELFSQVDYSKMP